MTPTTPAKIIHITPPRVEHASISDQGASCARLIAQITGPDGLDGDLWFEVEEAYGQYLVDDRCDGFVIGLLHYAMSHGCDIVCDAPISEQLCYQLQTYLIPLLARYNPGTMYPTQILAEKITAPLQTKGAVGTGLSCGIDSLHAVKTYCKSPYQTLRLTHLVINDVGAYGRPEQQAWQFQHARDFAKEYGFTLIPTRSNYAQILSQRFNTVCAYANVFCVHCLAKLWGTYLFASLGYDFIEGFSLKGAKDLDATHYDALALDCYSTRTLKFYSEGAELLRYEKTQSLIDWEPAQKYLHVCSSDFEGHSDARDGKGWCYKWNGGPNCGHCPKCLRTLTTLDALGALDKFAKVFDLQDYRAHRKERLRWLAKQYFDRLDIMSIPAFEVLKPEILATDRLWFRLYQVHTFFRKFRILRRIYSSFLTPVLKCLQKA